MESFSDAFQLVLKYCRDELSQVSFSQWIKDIKPVVFKDNTAYLCVRSDFIKDLVEKKYRTLIENSFEKVFGFPVNAVFLSEEDKDGNPIHHPLLQPLSDKPPAQAAGNPGTPNWQVTPYSQSVNLKQSSANIEAKAVPPKPEDIFGGDYDYTFSTFIVGSSNKFAHAASQAVAANPAGAYNPLFIYGASGLGKTHLLYAIGADIHAARPNLNIIYVKGEEFTNQLIESIQDKKTKDFHSYYRNADILLMDDVQFIGGKESTQEEFFHTFNTLHQSGKQIVVTSDRPPKEIKTLEDRLRTRFEWGLIADIQPPDFETRVAIIRRKAELIDIHISDDVIEYIANRLKNNIRQLEGVVKKLKAYKHLANTPSTIIAAQTAIRDVMTDNQPIPVTVERIINEVGRTYNVSAEDIKSNKRSAQISLARQVAMYIVRQVTQMSVMDIGKEFGSRDHSTVVYTLKQVDIIMSKNTKVKEIIEDITKNIRDS